MKYMGSIIGVRPEDPVLVMSYHASTRTTSSQKKTLTSSSDMVMDGCSPWASPGRSSTQRPGATSAAAGRAARSRMVKMRLMPPRGLNAIFHSHYIPRRGVCVKGGACQRGAPLVSSRRTKTHREVSMKRTLILGAAFMAALFAACDTPGTPEPNPPGAHAPPAPGNEWDYAWDLPDDGNPMNWYVTR